MKPNVINFHITDRCNYHCLYCFVKFPHKEPSLAEAKHVVDECKQYFAENGIEEGRINIAGGEPLLYPYIEDIIRYIYSQGLRCSIITNGSRLDEGFCRRMAGYLYMVGISLDAATDEGNRRVGRTSNTSLPSLERLERACSILRRGGVRLKINTVVSKLNLYEDMAAVYRRLQPDKVKIFCMHVIENINAKAAPLAPTAEEYDRFVLRNSVRGIPVVAEGPESMQNAYFMINPQGVVYMNDGGTDKQYGSCHERPLTEIFREIPLYEEKYYARYDGIAG